MTWYIYMATYIQKHTHEVDQMLTYNQNIHKTMNRNANWEHTIFCKTCAPFLR